MLPSAAQQFRLETTFAFSFTFLSVFYRRRPNGSLPLTLSRGLLGVPCRAVVPE
jgi:hypothetical protein